MTLSYTVSAEDLLEYRLYITSKSDTHRKRRLRSRWLVPILYIGLGVFVVIATSKWLYGLVFMVFAIAWWWLQPIYNAYSYRRMYLRNIKKKFEDALGQKTTLEISKKFVNVIEEGGQTSMKIKKFKNLIEVPTHFFLQMDNNNAVMIPKEAVENPEVFIAELTSYGLTYIDEKQYKWG
ncbi:hypothetical protein NBRC110019_16420 [Neptunitalea chrysea]|uniref:YcxB-like C-terminal domain-containing protein n=1 Tax=Neptunitalea chrysea TaxID=1647581 RepID=A0A9W6B7B5_9FLAO|nr:YcxB family protein [Neptunitalea chrysea]GLB52602.1 hypothetical protein NBRC110019_16420 [Neptunitalea chrysea]